MGRQTNKNLRNRRRKQQIEKKLRQLSKQLSKAQRPVASAAAKPA